MSIKDASTRTPSRGSTLKIVVVCTGNRCRSPYAEAALRNLTRGLPVEIESAGTLDIEGGPVPAPLARLASEAGIDLTRHRARALSKRTTAQADLVLGLAREHTAAAVVDAGALPERTFLFAELVRLLEEISPLDEADPIEHARRAIALAHEARLARPTFVPNEEIDDPMGGPRSAYAAMIRRVDDAVTRLVPALFGLENARPAEEPLPRGL